MRGPHGGMPLKRTLPRQPLASCCGTGHETAEHVPSEMRSLSFGPSPWRSLTRNSSNGRMRAATLACKSRRLLPAVIGPGTGGRRRVGAVSGGPGDADRCVLRHSPAFGIRGPSSPRVGRDKPAFRFYGPYVPYFASARLIYTAPRARSHLLMALHM